MAYDIFLRTSIPKNYARGTEAAKQPSRVATVASLGLAGFVLLLPGILRSREIAKYRKAYSIEDLPPVHGRRPARHYRRLSTTIESPAVPMEDLVFGNRQPE